MHLICCYGKEITFILSNMALFQNTSCRCKRANSTFCVFICFHTRSREMLYERFPCVTPSCQRHWWLYSERCSGPGGKSFSLNYACFGTSVSWAKVYLSKVWQSHIIPGNRGLLRLCFTQCSVWHDHELETLRKCYKSKTWIQNSIS